MSKNQKTFPLSLLSSFEGGLTYAVAAAAVAAVVAAAAAVAAVNKMTNN